MKPALKYFFKQTNIVKIIPLFILKTNYGIILC